jgi:hypothetical protein
MARPFLLPDRNGWPHVDVEIIDNDEGDVACTLAEIYGEGIPPPSEAEHLPAGAPHWQKRTLGITQWIYLTTSTTSNFMKQAWQAERLWAMDDDTDDCNFRAAHVLLEWVQAKKNPVFGVVIKMLHRCPGYGKRTWMVLAEPWGQPKRWDDFQTSMLRRLKFDDNLKARVVDAGCSEWKGPATIRRVTDVILRWMQLCNPRLRDITAERGNTLEFLKWSFRRSRHSA